MVSFSFGKEKVHKVIDKVAAQVCKTAKFPGFRPGKATPDVAKVFAKKYILDLAQYQLSQDAYDEILYETKWKQSFPPKVEKAAVTMDSFAVDILVSYMPTFDLKQYKGFALNDPKEVPTKDYVIGKITEEICYENATSQKFTENDCALAGDEIVVNYTIEDISPATLEELEPGEKKEKADLSALNASNVELTVGRSQTIPGFDEEIIGMKIGEKRTIELNVPADWDKIEVAHNINRQSFSIKNTHAYILFKNNITVKEDINTVIETLTYTFEIIESCINKNKWATFHITTYADNSLQFYDRFYDSEFRELAHTYFSKSYDYIIKEMNKDEFISKKNKEKLYDMKRKYDSYIKKYKVVL